MLFFQSLSTVLLEDITSKMFQRERDEKPALLGPIESVPLDNTAGWSTLESSLQALEALVRAVGLIADTDCRDGNELLFCFSDEHIDLIIGSASKHESRYV